MTANVNGWVKLYRAILADEKVRQLCPSHRWTFTAYLLIAQHEGRWRGYLTNQNGKPMTCTELAADIGGVDKATISRTNKIMIEIGLLEATEGGRLKVRNYSKYQCSSVAPAQQTRPQKQADVANDVAPVQQNVANDVAPVQRSSTKQTTCKERRKGKKNTSHSREFEVFYASYPKRLRRGEAASAWNARLKEGVSPDSLIEASRNYAAYCAAVGTEERYIMYPSSFLGSDRRGYEEWQEPRTAPKNGGKREGSREAEFDEAARLLGIEVTG